jgi:molybdopterin/thiamine biosynthesis adenylyltransferase
MHKELTDQELDTYSRQIVLADIGYDGQLKLRNAKVCLIGVGGLGSPTALKLVGMGIGCLRFVDRDIVSRSDLHRQHLYDTDSIGMPKVEVAFNKLHRLNPDVTLEPVPESLNSMNAEELIAGMDVVIDGLDQPEPRYIVNRICNKLKIPYIFGAAIESFGNVSTILPGQTFCLECFMPDLKNEDLPVCGLVGVHPSIIGIVSSVQVAEAVQVLIGQEPKLYNKLLYVDLRQFEFNILDIPSLESCRVCGSIPDGEPMTVADRFFEETCARDGRRNFVISPVKRIDLNMEQLGAVIKDLGLPIKSSGRLGITFEKTEQLTACILKSGIMIAQTPPLMDSSYKNEVLATYRSILIEGMGLSADILPNGG